MSGLDALDRGTEAAATEAERVAMADRHGAHKDVARNLGAFAIAQLIVRLAGLGVVVVVARLLSSADFGRYSVALALSSLFTVFVESGMGGYLVREGTQSPHRASVALGHVITLQIVTGTLAVGACAIVAVSLNYDSATFVATIVLAVSAVAMIAQRSFLAILMSLNRSRLYAGFQSGQAIVTAVATVAAAVLGAGPAGIAVGVLISSLLSFPVAFALLHRHWDQRIRFVREGLWETLAVAAAYSAAKLGSALLTYIDAVMVQAIKGNVAAARYGASYRLMMALRMAPLVYADGLAQPAARLARDDRKGLEEVLNRAMRQLYVAGLAIGLGGFLLSDRVMSAVFGAPYGAAGTAAGLLLLTLPVSFACHPFVIVALAMGLEKNIARIFAMTVVVNVGTNLVLIPEYGPTGAAIAMLISTAVLYGQTARLLWGNGIRFSGFGRLLRISFAGAAMGLTVVLAGALPLPAVIVLGAAVYVVLIRLLRVLDRTDLDMMPMGSRLGWLAAR
jgi:O-antigen/teichoic acid export membrane protein